MTTTSAIVLVGRPASRENRGVPWLLLMAWAAVFLNVMAFIGLPTVVPIPPGAGQLLTQGALPVALVIALMMNPKGVLRPHVYLVGFTLMAVLALAVSIHSEFVLGSTFRACRFLGFLSVLWLLSPWFGRRDMSLLRCHRICLIAVLTMVITGAAISPGLAFSFDGRLSGVLWPIPATQVAHYAAVVFGTTAILWMCQVLSGRNALICIGLSAVVLMGTHTRTALIATAVGLAAAGLSLFIGHSRVRRTSLWATVLVVLTLGVFANELKTWALRGQTSQEATDLTGRTKVWDAVFGAPRPRLNEIFGSGMSNMSFEGLPIDSNWVGTYFDQGWVGVVLDATILVVLLIVAATRERSPHRAIAIFLIVYCLFASITETGLSNPSPYLLDLAVAASLILPRQDVAR
jgi:hypothetical protein